MLYVAHDTANSTAPLPVIRLKSTHVFLRTETSTCGIKHVSETGPHAQTRRARSDTLAARYFYPAMPNVERLDLRSIMDLKLDPDLTPSFKTFNIARTYSIKAFVTVVCAGKDDTLLGKYTRCTLLAKDYNPGLLEYTIPPEVVDEMDVEMTKEPPPPYQQVVETCRPAAAPQPRARHRRRHRHGIFFGAGFAPNDGGAVAATMVASGGGGGGGGGC